VSEAMSTATEASYDVVVLGGGLAGLTLALDLKRRRPDTSVFVAEKREDAAPGATFKVGESSVEVGAHYYADMVGLKDHLDAVHYGKFGLRFFLPAGDNTDIARRTEWGIRRWPVADAYQIDRGVFENELARRCRDAGVDLAMGTFIHEIELGDEKRPYSVTVVRGGEGGERSRVEGRWLVDASGRASLLKRRLGMERIDTGHHINSAWFRLDGGIDLEDWSQDEEWLDRIPERGLRRHSTNHLCGEGYWVWLIQLGTGPISIGVVADPRFHPFEQINDLDRMLGWLHEHEPQLARIVEARRDQVLDFLMIEDFAYSCERVYSNDRWCLTGEAGVFADPLYSPGSDFIAYGNNFIADLIVRDLNGEDIEDRTEFFNFLFFQLFTPTLYLYRDQYQFFGNPQVMVAKQLFDHCAYFSTLAFLFIQNILTRPELMFDIVDDVTERVIPMLERVQGFFREWHALDQRQWQGVSILMQEFEGMWLQQQPLVTSYDDEGLVKQFKLGVDHIEAMVVVMFHWAARLLPEQPGEDVPINPRAISLQPERWEPDGLFAGSGISLLKAKELLPGIEECLLETRGAELLAS
jgi:flavin-dependent dehydrogenase